MERLSFSIPIRYGFVPPNWKGPLGKLHYLSEILFASGKEIAEVKKATPGLQGKTVVTFERKLAPPPTALLRFARFILFATVIPAVALKILQIRYRKQLELTPYKFTDSPPPVSKSKTPQPIVAIDPQKRLPGTFSDFIQECYTVRRKGDGVEKDLSNVKYFFLCISSKDPFPSHVTNAHLLNEFTDKGDTILVRHKETVETAWLKENLPIDEWESEGVANKREIDHQKKILALLSMESLYASQTGSLIEQAEPASRALKKDDKVGIQAHEEWGRQIVAKASSSPSERIFIIADEETILSFCRKGSQLDIFLSANTTAVLVPNHAGAWLGHELKEIYDLFMELGKTPSPEQSPSPSDEK